MDNAEWMTDRVSPRLMEPSPPTVYHLISHYPTGVWPAQSTLLMGDYKIIKTCAFDRVELFHLKNDLSETNDLSKTTPEKARELDQQLMTYLKSVDAVFPSASELAVDRKGVLMKKGGAGKKR